MNEPWSDEVQEVCEPIRDEMYADLLPVEMERVEFAFLAFIKGEAQRTLDRYRADAEKGYQGSMDADAFFEENRALEQQIEEGILAAKAAPCNGWGHLWRPTPEVTTRRRFKSAEEAAAWFQMEERLHRAPVKLDPDSICEKACAEFKEIREDVLASDRKRWPVRTAADRISDDLYREFHD